MTGGALAQDGARAYHLVPEGTNIISLTETILHTKGARGVFDVGVLTPSYRRSIDVFGNAGTILIGMPIGGLSGGLNTPFGVINADTDVALGDLFIGGSLGLIGSPSLAPMDYVQYQPGFRASLAGRLFLPTGDYDSSRLLNLGGNRWSLQAMLPISYVLGSSMVDPDLTTFEIMPTVQIFGDDTDPVGPFNVVSQDPVFGVEGHITRSFGRVVWASLDAAYEVGGETARDGRASGDDIEIVRLGATLGLTLNAALAMRISYDEVVMSNDPEGAGRIFKATAAYRF